MHVFYEELAKSRNDNSQQLAKSSDTLVFPANGEIWLDELDHYNVEARGCPTAKKGHSL
jgi:hypothetical protein